MPVFVRIMFTVFIFLISNVILFDTLGSNCSNNVKAVAFILLFVVNLMAVQPFLDYAWASSGNDHSNPAQYIQPVQPQQAQLASTFVVYHGTQTLENVRSIIRTGFQVGRNDYYGSGFYATTVFSEAADIYADGNGYVLAIHLHPHTYITKYVDVPGITAKQKQIHANLNNISMVYIEHQNWVLIYGKEGSYVHVRGYLRLEVYDCQYNQVQI